MAINVYIVRHGQTYLNLYHRMQGWSDSHADAKRGWLMPPGPVKP
ncbi:histidine phosphatase family protein [Limosilactobacillus fermentum]